MKAAAWCVSLWAASPTTAAADESVWTWEQCLAAARSQTPPELVAAGFAEEGAHLLSKAAESGFHPQARFQGGAGVGDDVREGESGAAPGFVATLDGELPLYPNRRPKGLKQLREAEAQASQAAGAILRADFEFRLRTAFVDLLAAQESVSRAEESRIRLQALTDAVEARYRIGQEHQGHAAVARAALAVADNEAQQSVRTLELCRSRLETLLEVAPGQIAQASGKLGCAPPPDHPGDIDARVRATPEVAAAGETARQAMARVAMARSQDDYQLDAVARAAPRSDSWNNDDSEWFAGVRLSLPLYDGGRSRREAEAAQQEIHQAEARQAVLERDLRLDCQAAWVDYQSAASRQALQPDLVASARLRADIARREYETSLASLAAWEAAENDLAAKVRADIQVRRDAAIAQARWERLAGPHGPGPNDNEGNLP